MNLFKIITTSLLIYLTIKINKIIMTQSEAVKALVDLKAQVEKIKTEVQKLIDTAEGEDKISPEMEAAIIDVRAALQGVDELNEDAPTEDVTG